MIGTDGHCKECGGRAEWMAAGKKPMPTPEQLRIMALKLGTPKEYWPALNVDNVGRKQQND